mgnify:CR=1 FL=1
MQPLPIGTKVRCISPVANRFGFGEVRLGQVYTIKDIIHKMGQSGYHLEETKGCYKIERFIPITPLRRQPCSK